MNGSLIELRHNPTHDSIFIRLGKSSPNSTTLSDLSATRRRRVYRRRSVSRPSVLVSSRSPLVRKSAVTFVFTHIKGRCISLSRRTQSSSSKSRTRKASRQPGQSTSRMSPKSTKVPRIPNPASPSSWAMRYSKLCPRQRSVSQHHPILCSIH